MRWAIAIAAATQVLSCADPGDRVKRLSSPEDDPVFVSRCRHSEGCLADAKATCPSGYQKVSFEGDVRQRELIFKCHGKPDW